jgi:hypothetical protein
VVTIILFDQSTWSCCIHSQLLTINVDEFVGVQLPAARGRAGLCGR